MLLQSPCNFAHLVVIEITISRSFYFPHRRTRIMWWQSMRDKNTIVSKKIFASIEFFRSFFFCTRRFFSLSVSWCAKTLEFMLFFLLFWNQAASTCFWSIKNIHVALLSNFFNSRRPHVRARCVWVWNVCSTVHLGFLQMRFLLARKRITINDSIKFNWYINN